eukprot:16449282-Heterocapsa_arctica.AAC.1
MEGNREMNVVAEVLHDALIRVQVLLKVLDVLVGVKPEHIDDEAQGDVTFRHDHAIVSQSELAVGADGLGIEEYQQRR